MTGGYTGKILRVNLTNRTTSTIDTIDYEEYIGGIGIAAAIFLDLVGDQLPFDAYDPRNVIGLIGSPLSGTLASSGSRCIPTGLGPEAYPVEWFNRSNCGGRFPSQMKWAGWDGIIIEGAADAPVWINVIDNNVIIEDASDIWGLGTIATQEEIWRRVTDNASFREWIKIGDSYTNQKPAVICIGQAGENLSRMACLISDLSGAGESGLGAAWGSKKLKAVSCIGLGGVSVADPQALMDARLYDKNRWIYNVDDPVNECPVANMGVYRLVIQRPAAGNFGPLTEPCRPISCTGCPQACRYRTQSGVGSEAQCYEAGLARMAINKPYPGVARDLIEDLGINYCQITLANSYVKYLYDLGELGPGKEIESNLPFDLFPTREGGTTEWWEPFCRCIVNRTDIGAELAEGVPRAAMAWGKWERDSANGNLNSPNWGFPGHYDPRIDVEWGYGSLLGERDINQHSFTTLCNWAVNVNKMVGLPPVATAEELVNIFASKAVPYTNDPFMWDYSENEATGIYSDHRVKTNLWNIHYGCVFQQSALYCEWAHPDWINGNNKDYDGSTPEKEPMFLNAVTGWNNTFADYMETGRKIWNLKRIIWILQGRHRDMEKFSRFIYDVPTTEDWPGPRYDEEAGEWVYGNPAGRTLNEKKFEEWKSKFFKAEGWDPATGWPKRKTLEDMDLGKYADLLESKGKLGGGT